MGSASDAVTSTTRMIGADDADEVDFMCLKFKTSAFIARDDGLLIPPVLVVPR